MGQARRRTRPATSGSPLGQGEPTVVFVAHLDEVGFVVRGIEESGLLELEPLGGIFPELWEARPALVHTGSTTVPGVFQPRDSSGALRADVGTASRTAGPRHSAFGSATRSRCRRSTSGSAGTRATGRSFDDRVGSAAQVLALRRLDPRRLKHTVIFLWSVREEIGLEGARVAADSLRFRPARVHAIDTFVSADSPLEPQAFAVAPLGRGPVARALDNSSVTPPAYLDSLVALARRRGIPLQVGTTNGGNDGSVFGAYGVPDVPIGWPLRYSHSPVEVIDLRDLVHPRGAGPGGGRELVARGALPASRRVRIFMQYAN